jgi:hypothetical protein
MLRSIYYPAITSPAIFSRIGTRSRPSTNSVRSSRAILALLMRYGIPLSPLKPPASLDQLRGERRALFGFQSGTKTACVSEEVEYAVEESIRVVTFTQRSQALPVFVRK